VLDQKGEDPELLSREVLEGEGLVNFPLNSCRARGFKGSGKLELLNVTMSASASYGSSSLAALLK